MIEYAVLRGKVSGSHRAEDVQRMVREAGNRSYTSNHFHIMVDADGRTWRCPVNVRSQDGSEVWFKIRDTFTEHPILTDLPDLPTGLTRLPNRRPGRTLDFVREPLFDRFTMRHLPLGVAGSNNDVQDHVELHVQQAMNQAGAEIFVFGSFWEARQFPPDEVLGTQDGVHDIHMNQGNDRGHTNDDGVWQDGGVILSFPSTGRFVGIFLAFNSQVWFTDNQNGHRLRGFAEGPLVQGTAPQPGPAPEEPPVNIRVKIVAALLNPDGADQGRETVTLFNAHNAAVSLNGWQIIDRQNGREVLGNITLPRNEARTVSLSGNGAQLSNRGGSIRLLDNAGRQVHAVTYTAAQARSGEIVTFS